MREPLAALIVVIAGCGRVNFDVRDSTIDAGDAGADASLVEPPGLVGHWKLDEISGTNANDSVGTADGTLVAGTGGLPMWTPGHDAGGIAFAGNGDYVDMFLPPALTDLPTLTVMAWVRPSAFDVSSQRNCIVDKTNATVGWSLFMAELQPGDVGFFAAHTTSPLRRVSAANQLVIGQWSHVVATWDGTSTFAGVRVYVDGVETAYGSETNGAGTRPSDSPGGFGFSCVPPLAIEAALDDVRVYNRVLSAPEVATLYALTR